MLAILLLAFPLYILAARPNELVIIDEKIVGEAVKTVPPRKSKGELPKNFDYRPLGLLTEDLNQHIPVYW